MPWKPHLCRTLNPNVRGSAGFTLIEMIVVLAVLGLALALVASYGPPASGGLSLRGAASELAGGLREARAQAIAGGHPVGLTIDLAQHGWRVGQGPVTPLPEGIQVRVLTVVGEATGSVGRILFLPDGSSTGGRIELSGANRQMQVGVDWLSGRVSSVEQP